MHASAELAPAITAEPEQVELAGRRIHFMGAGGIGVSALMELARARGARVSGCDCASGGQVPRLLEQGLPVEIGHAPLHAETCDELVYSAAVPEAHPELARARALGKAVRTRMNLLGRLARGTRAICVTGSHGKTTLTWMIAHLLIQAGRDPSLLVGGVVPSLDSNVRIPRGRGLRSMPLAAPETRPGSGASRLGDFVLEVDESDNRLDEIVPTLPVVTNIDCDHLEHYGSLDNLQQAVTGFLAAAASSLDPRSALIGCGDDRRVRAALDAAARRSGRPAFDYGFEPGRSFQGFDVHLNGMHATFSVTGPMGQWTGLELPMPGRHNVLNALGALAAAWRLGLDERSIRAGLATCERVGRRFEVKGTVRGVRVVDDYGHHPAEIEATLRAGRASTSGRIGVLFQPHRFTRTAALLDEFARCFAESGAQAVFVQPVYAASESPIPGADHRTLAREIKRLGHPCASAVKDRAAGVKRLLAWAQPGDTVLVQGAGDVTAAAEELLAGLRKLEA